MGCNRITQVKEQVYRGRSPKFETICDAVCYLHFLFHFPYRFCSSLIRVKSSLPSISRHPSRRISPADHCVMNYCNALPLRREQRSALGSAENSLNYECYYSCSLFFIKTFLSARLPGNGMTVVIVLVV